MNSLTGRWTWIAVWTTWPLLIAALLIPFVLGSPLAAAPFAVLAAWMGYILSRSRRISFGPAGIHVGRELWEWSTLRRVTVWKMNAALTVVESDHGRAYTFVRLTGWRSTLRVLVATWQTIDPRVVWSEGSLTDTVRPSGL